MRFATLPGASPDGKLVLVSRDGSRAVEAGPRAPSLLLALEHWAEVQGELGQLSGELEADSAPGIFPFKPGACLAPLPRTWQWCDGSAFLLHAHLMERAFHTPPIPDLERIPLMYQGASDDFLGPGAEVPLPEEALGIDFEGEFGVVLDEVPMGIEPLAALDRIRLVVQLNDWSLRLLGPREMGTGFGFLQAKPSTSFAPLALTPDELGEHWRGGRVHLNLHINWNGAPFGHPNGGEMAFHFGELIAHAARTRRLRAGCIIGSGTVSNRDRAVGSACIAERRVLEILDGGSAVTGYMAFGDRVRMEARAPGQVRGPFGVIDQRVVSLIG